MARQIFRKEALDRLSSPEQLDQLMQVTSPRGWIALAALGLLLLAGLLWGIFGTIPTTAEGEGLLLRGRGVRQVTAPRAGRVLDVPVKVGDLVPKGRELVRLGSAADDPEPTILPSPYPARVLDVSVQKNASVEKDAVLVTLEPRDAPLRAVLYVPVAEGYQVAQAWDTATRKGGTVPVHVWPASVGKESGPLLGHVLRAGHFPATKAEMERTLGSQELADSLAGSGASLEVVVELETLPDKPDVYRWASPREEHPPLFSGTPCRGSITIRKQRPIALVFPTFGFLPVR
jgi:hypothetical protein